MSTAVGSHSGSNPLSLMSCVRESSPSQDLGSDAENEKNVAAGSKRKFWNPRKWFKRKQKSSEDGSSGEVLEQAKDALRSRSTSELSIAEEQTRRRSGTPMHPGLSVSHDSVFHSPHSGSDMELETAQSSSSLSIIHPVPDLRLQTELSERLRLRRGRGDTSEDDEGLPRSPCNSPTTTEGLLEKANIKDHPTKSHSTCSDGSLLSMGSSDDMDEDSFSQQSRHSSKMSLYEKKSTDPDSDLELGPSHLQSAPLNHSAAHHKSKVRPRRTHGAPRRKKVQQISSTVLPSTPEVNEDSSVRSLTPEVASSNNREIITELYTSSSSSMSKTTLTETQFKCSSLPPGLAGPGSETPSKLSRSCSNAGSKSQDHFGTLEEEEDKEEKSSSSFFERLFPRRSAKKKKMKMEEHKVQKTYSSSSSNYSSTSSSSVSTKPIAAPRSGAASRQRVQPIDIPASPELSSRPETDQIIQAKPSPEKSLSGTSPLQAELETLFKNRMTTTLSSSTPPKSLDQPVPKSPLLPPASPNSWSHHRFSKTSETKTFSNTREMRLEEFRSKMKIAGLSALQQRVLSHNDDDVDDAGSGFKSLTDLPTDVVRVNKPVTKSHSFKAVKPSFQHSEKSRFTYRETSSERSTVTSEEKSEKRQSIVKAASLDSVKNLEEIKMESFADVTISGPSHTAVVSVTNSEKQNDESEKVVKVSPGEVAVKEQQVSVTKIHMKREKETVQSTKTTAVPEFLNRQLNRVENRPSSNVIFKTPSPKIVDEQTKPKTTIFNFEPEVPKRKFSKDDVEIIDKEVNEEIVEVPKTPLVPISPMTPQSNRIYKKHSERKSSKSESLKSADSSSQDSLDKLDDKMEEPPQTPTDGVVLRKKSLVKQKAEEEPELMKVFARRSLKLKDSESEELSQQVKSMVQEEEALQKSRDSDKENHADSPQEERKKSVISIEARRKSIGKEPLVETKFVETTEVTLRKPIVANNKFAAYQRTISLNTPKVVAEVVNTDLKVKKQSSFTERPKTENWFLNLKKQEEEEGEKKSEDRKIVSDEILISPKSDFINEEEFTIKPKNFNQRKAEWEKRAQEALKKNVP